jgi:discoidin domain receptor family protein 2
VNTTGTKLFIVSVVVSGNFTEEEIEGGILKTDDLGKEYPLQRDEVQTTPSRDDRVNTAGAASGGPSGGSDSSGSKQYIGLVIGVLTAVILLLMAAIMFIVVRNRRLKSGRSHSVLPGAFGGAEKGVTINMKVSHSVHRGTLILARGRHVTPLFCIRELWASSTGLC